MSDPSEPIRTVATPQEQSAAAASASDETAAAPRNRPTPLNFGPPRAPGEVGTLGPYRVIKQLGAGGMGAVYLAVDTRLERKLALKVMLPEFAADFSAKERFLREARAAAKITHDNVVTVYEADERNGVPYITMQLLQGYPLDEYLKTRGAPPLPHVLRIARETALGLAAAHALGLVHRDIKPANLWLEAPNGRVKVLDFGLAKPVGSESEVTKSGAVVGSPAYMSPEQARGQKVDHRTDLFSLGTVLYRLCTGQNPFSGPTVMAVLMALGTEDPAPVRERNPNVPEALAQLIHQLLAKKPQERPQTAEEVAKRLRAILDQLLAPPPPTAAPEAEVPMATAANASTSQPVVVHPVPVQPPIVVPMQITAPQESVFAHLDEVSGSTRATEANRAAEPKPERKKSGGKGLWFAAGGAVLLAVVAVAVVVALLNKKSDPGTEKTPSETSGAPGDKGRPEPKKTDPKTADPDRAAAEWVLSVGGKVHVDDNWNNEIKEAPTLPRGAFRLTGINLHHATRATDAGLAILKGCNNLTVLALSSPQVTDAGLAPFKGYTKLQRLSLGSAQVTDAGVTCFKDCKALTYLSLWNTQVTDTGLAIFKDCVSLRFLDLRQTQVTDAGLVLFKDRTDLELLGLYSPGVTDAGLANFKDCKSLKHLFLHGAQLTDAGLAHFTDCKKLTALHLTGTQVTDAALLPFKDCNLTHLSLSARTTDAGLAHFKDCKNLVELGLNDTQVTDDGVEHIIGLDKLTALSLKGTKVTAEGVAKIQKALPGCKIARDGGVSEPVSADRAAAEWVLSLGGKVKITDAAGEKEVAAAKELPGAFTLTRIDLSDTEKLTDADLDRLTGLAGLTHLHLDRTPITDAGLARIKHLTGLVRLHLGVTKVTDAGLAHLKNMKGLLSLGLHNTRVTDAGMLHVRDLPRLISLNLNDTAVTDTGLERIKGQILLKHLYVAGTGVTDNGLAHLRALDKLMELDLNRTKVTAEGVAKLQKALPKCQIKGEPPKK
jgi:serine/threonine protein kinase/Leucine-rich repeat (LRR) protein